MQIMDSWMLFGGSERTNFGLSGGVFPQFGSPSLPKETPSGWVTGQTSNSDHLMVDSRQGVVENPAFIESCYVGIQETISESSLRELLRNDVKEHATNCGSSSFTEGASREKEDGSKDSSSIVDPDAQESSLIDLKLGGLVEWKGTQTSKASKTMGSFPQQESPVPVKRGRSTSLNGQVALCQVHGCNMDLSSFKDYYKRHRVCQVHSKTAKVVVNGIQQRFCQQCSRFHLLSEFDDGKRSCRKRLAGHNERRRKPPIVFQTGKNRAMLPYHGGNFLKTTLSGKSPFLCQDRLPHNGNYEYISWSKHAGLDDPLASAQMQTSAFKEPTKSFALGCMEKEISFVNTSSNYNCYTTRYVPGTSVFSSNLDTGADMKGCAGVVDSSRACSLLSSQPEALYPYPLGIPLTQPSIFRDAVENKSSFIDSEELPLQSSANIICSSGIDPPGCNQAGLMPYVTKSSFDGLASQMQKNFDSVHFGGSEGALPREHHHTIDLLQLSSLFQDAESHTRSHQVKQELETFGLLPIT